MNVGGVVKNWNSFHLLNLIKLLNSEKSVFISAAFHGKNPVIEKAQSEGMFWTELALD